MGMMDSYAPEMGASEGTRELDIVGVEFVTSKNKGTEGIKFTFTSDGEHKMYKTLYQGKMFNRFLTSLVTDIGLDPKELGEASRNGFGEAWIKDNFQGKHISIWCGYGEPNAEGKKYLTPMSTAEREFKAWIESQNNSPRAPSPSVPSAQPAQGEQKFPDDIPF
jgi:hypothetical protein